MKKLFICIVLSVFNTMLPKESFKKHLVLHFDINQTIIATDVAQGKSIDETINARLARVIYFNWDGTKEDSFYRFVEKQIEQDYPSYSRVSDEFKRERRKRLKKLSLVLENASPALYEDYIEKKEKVKDILSHDTMVIFPSFFKLITWLQENNISYTLHLRTFGKDLAEVVSRVEKQLPITFDTFGSFDSGKLFIDNHTIVNAQEIYQLLRQTKHYALQDSYLNWKAHDFQCEGGKPFYLDLSNEEEVTIFFDDNADDPDRSILKPMNLYGETENIDQLITLGNIVPVETIDAVLNEDYFIEKVKAKLD